MHPSPARTATTQSSGFKSLVRRGETAGAEALSHRQRVPHHHFCSQVARVVGCAQQHELAVDPGPQRVLAAALHRRGDRFNAILIQKHRIPVSLKDKVPRLDAPHPPERNTQQRTPSILPLSAGQPPRCPDTGYVSQCRARAEGQARRSDGGIGGHEACVWDSTTFEMS